MPINLFKNPPRPVSRNVPKNLFEDVSNTNLSKPVNDQTLEHPLFTSPTPDANNPHPIDASGVLNAATSSEQNFGKDIAQAGYLLFGGQKKIDATTQQYLDNGSKLTDLAKKQTDPVQKQKYADMAIEMFKDAQKVGGEVIGNTRTPEQIVGDAIGVGADILAAGDYSGIAKSAGIVEKPAASIIKTIQKGAIHGAIQGGSYGAAKGGANSASDDQNATNIAKGALKGAVEGAVGGAIIGGAAEGISAKIQGKPLRTPTTPKEQLVKIQETISPKPTVKEAKLAESQGRLVKGKEPTLLKSGTEDTIIPSKQQVQAAKTIQKKIPGASNMSEPELYTALDKKIVSIAKKITPEMEETPIKLTTVKKLNTDFEALKKTQLDGAYTRDEISTVKKMQQQFGERIRSFMKGGNMNDLWQEAKDYDVSIPENVKKANNLSPESLQAKKTVWLQNRAVLRDAINDSSSGLGKTSQKAFSDMHDMYQSQEGILSKAKVNTKPLPSKVVQFGKSPAGKLIGAAAAGASALEVGKKIVTGGF